MNSLKTLAIALFLTIGGSGFADTLSMEDARESRLSGGDRPTRGMSMERVREGWGQPATRRAPVGEPPITRWEYEGFIVYFEHDRVIHAVLKHEPAG